MMNSKIYSALMGCLFILWSHGACSLLDEAPGEGREHDGEGQAVQTAQIDGLVDRGGAPETSSVPRDVRLQEHVSGAAPERAVSPGRRAPWWVPRACVHDEDCSAGAPGTGWCTAAGSCEYVCAGGEDALNPERSALGCVCPGGRAQVEVCNGRDDDCDGVVDNIFAGGRLAARGALTCVTSRAGALRCTGAGPAAGEWPATAARLGQVSVGLEHGCALGGDAAVYCWGDNRFGQAVPGGGAHINEPTRVALDGQVVEVASGGYHTCALARGGAIFCWGQNDYAQLGNGTRRPQSGVVEIAASLDFVGVSAGASHACGVTRQGQVLCWGANHIGQAGQSWLEHINVPTELDIPLRVAQVSAGRDHSCALTVEGRVYCWGDNQFGQLGDETTVARAHPEIAGQEFKLVALSAGGRRTCGLSQGGRVYCWGDNEGGSLGVGDTLPIHSLPQGVARSMDFSTVVAGESHTCGLNLQGQLFCWGDGRQGQLGGADHTSSRAPRPADCFG